MFPSPGSEAKSGTPSLPPIVVAAFKREMNKLPTRLTEHSHAHMILWKPLLYYHGTYAQSSFHLLFARLRMHGSMVLYVCCVLFFDLQGEK
jgi:hypothetical protein